MQLLFFTFLTILGVESILMSSHSIILGYSSISFFYVMHIRSSRPILIKFIEINIYFIKNVKCFIKYIMLFEQGFSTYSNFIIRGYVLVLLPWLLTLISLVVLPLLFISFNIISKLLAILPSSLRSSSLLLLLTFIWSLKNLYWSFAMSVCAFNSLHNGEYSNLLIVAVFLTSLFWIKDLCQLKIHIY